MPFGQKKKIAAHKMHERTARREREEKQAKCPHRNQRLDCEGATGILTCLDCGLEQPGTITSSILTEIITFTSK